MTFSAYIRGLPETPSVTEINIRSGAGTGYALVFKAAVGMSGLPVLDVKADEQGNNFQGKVYQWFKLQFPNGQQGWARDDLLEVVGDGTAFGYGKVAVQTFAFVLNRLIATTAAPLPPTPAAAPPAAAPAPAPAPAAPSIPKPDATVPAPAPAAAGGPEGWVNMRDGANVRSGPGANNAAVAKLDRNTRVSLIEVKSDQQGGVLRWVHIRAGSVDGWMREDVLRFEASAAPLGLTKADLYPGSMPNRWWVRGYEGPQGHWGWDWGAAVGEPVLCGPKGGLVTASVQCANCTADRPSFKHHGLQLSDPKALGDSAWNFGYGHYVIVRYLNQDLPESTRQALDGLGLSGAHIYAMHAHLNSRAVEAGQTLAAGATIGTCGDTGNSEAAHLHLEIRASKNANDSNWAGMKKNLLDPTILYWR